MPTITFTLSDFGLASLASKFPTVRFIPSQAGIAGARLFSTTPIEVTPDPAGVGVVELAATDGVVPEVFYTVHISHLNSGGVPTHFDVLGLRIFVPTGYVGALADLPGVPLSPNSVLVSLDPPPEGYKGFYLNAPGPGLPPGDPDNPASSGTGILEIVS